jgi:epoxyqueuosine reductase
MKTSEPELLGMLRDLAHNHAARAFGVADLDSLKTRIPDLLSRLPGDFGRAVVTGVRLQDGVMEDIVDRPTTLYFHNYRQANYLLDRIGLLLADTLQAEGYRAVAVPASQIVARNPMVGHISHKLLGWAAGMGFIGRNTLLIHPDYGARMRYVSVLTDAPLPANEPIEDGCGECRACMDVCPARAIHERPEEFDLDACYAKLTEFTRLSGIGQHICGVCVKACSGRTIP